MLIMTSSVVDVNVTPALGESNNEDKLPEIDEAISNDSNQSNKSTESLHCVPCQKEFNDKEELYNHILTHVKLPFIIVQRVDDFPVSKPARLKKLTPLKLSRTAKNCNFTIIKSPVEFDTSAPEASAEPRIPKLRILLPEQLSEQALENSKKPAEPHDTPNENSSSDITPTIQPLCNGDKEMVELHSIPNDSQSPSFPGSSPAQPDVSDPSTDDGGLWPEQPTDDPLQLTQSGEKEAETHNNLLQNFLNDANDASPKDSVLSSNETEYISLERLAGPQCPVCGERCMDQSSLDVHQKAMGHYPNNSLVPYSPGGVSLPPSPLESLANLPMQQLAQQVNRLQQGQVHQQNVLINIQQFGQPMPHSQYRPPDMPPPYPQQHYPPHQPQPPPPHLYGMPPTSSYHHQPGPPPPPHPMYYPPTSGLYPPPQQHHQFSPPPPQPHHQAMMPPRQPPPPRMPPQRMPPPPPPQQSSPPVRTRMRAPMPPRGPSPRMQSVRPPGPRAPNAPVPNRPLRRIAPMPTENPKKKRLDVLIPDTNDNDDCHVISMQKCNDGLPIIKNVQGATQPTETDPVVHLTDSITLSVRNPSKEAPVVQKKNDAKAVANILATRGITVTPAAKSQKEITETKKPAKSQSPPVAINLNNAVSIIPTARSGQQARPNERSPRTPTVDLTDDEPTTQPQQSQKSSPGTTNKRNLPHLCDLCPAQYPTLQSLMNHRRTYHKAGAHELGVPVIDLKQSSVLAKLVSLGIQSYIPLPQLGSNSNSTFALPVVSINSVRNPNICNISALGSGALLPLGPLRHISNLPNAKQ